MATTNQMVGSEKIRIRLKAYDHVILGLAARTPARASGE